VRVLFLEGFDVADPPIITITTPRWPAHGVTRILYHVILSNTQSAARVLLNASLIGAAEPYLQTESC
jgi:hypothetical protein